MLAGDKAALAVEDLRFPGEDGAMALVVGAEEVEGGGASLAGQFAIEGMEAVVAADKLEMEEEIFGAGARQIPLDHHPLTAESGIA